MKRFITALLTLALITGLSSGDASAAQPGVSEELYAGLYSPDVANSLKVKDFTVDNTMTKVQSAALPWHRGIPVAGIDRLIPVAGDDSKDITVNCHATPDAVYSGDCPNVMDPDDCPNIMDPGLDNLHINSAFLPWHRGYIYR